MKITEKMYLLAKEIIQEYESNQELFEKLSNGMSIVVIENKKLKKEEDFSFEIRNCYIDCIAQFEPNLRPETEKEIISWHDTIDKLNRIDKLEFQDIVLLTKAARNDPFWKNNFMSLIKLRRKNKDKIPYWKVFKEKFKFEKSKSESTFDAMNEVLKNIK